MLRCPQHSSQMSRKKASSLERAAPPSASRSSQYSEAPTAPILSITRWALRPDLESCDAAQMLICAALRRLSTVAPQSAQVPLKER